MIGQTKASEVQRRNLSNTNEGRATTSQFSNMANNVRKGSVGGANTTGHITTKAGTNILQKSLGSIDCKAAFSKSGKNSSIKR